MPKKMELTLLYQATTKKDSEAALMQNMDGVKDEAFC
jgi:hypothetical protein